MLIRSLLLTLSLLVPAGTAIAAEPWSPAQAVELVVMAEPGSGADQIARLMQRIIEDRQLSPHAVIAVNKPGGEGVEAMQYLQGKSGDDHVLMLCLNGVYTAPSIDPDLDLSFTSFTPIARMAIDHFLLWIRADREDDISDLDSYIQTVRKAGKEWKVGGTGSGQEDAILTAMMEKMFDYEVTYIPLPGGGMVAEHLVAGQIDSSVNNPAEQQAYYAAGSTKALVQFSADRLPAFADVPTASELGYDIEHYLQRSIAGPPAMSSPAQQWYAELFRQVFESEEWQGFCADDGLDCSNWSDTDTLQRFHDEQLVRHSELIKAVGASAISTQ